MPPKGWRKSKPTRQMTDPEKRRLIAENVRLQARLDLLDKYAKALGIRFPEA